MMAIFGTAYALAYFSGRTGSKRQRAQGVGHRAKMTAGPQDN